jgi:hypothetical protein
MTRPALSVIVSTRDRREAVERLMASLAKKSLAPASYEVIVVVDGSADDTASAARAWPVPFRLEVVERSGVGVAAGRNAGASVASGPVLLFLADDLDPAPGLLESHVAAHEDQPDAIIVGPYPPAPARVTGYLAMALRGWWLDRFEAMREPSHRFSYRDCLGGNLSIGADRFRQLGGFDPHFTETHEDHELGARALAAGGRIRFAPGASAERVRPGWRLTDAFRRARAEGRADALLGQTTPSLCPAMPASLFRASRAPIVRFAHRLAFSWPRASDLCLTVLRLALGLLEWLQLRSRWQRVFVAAERHCYLRGLADGLRSPAELYRFIEDGALAARNVASRDLELELAAGVREALDLVDRARPTSVRIRLHGTPVGTVASPPGTEPVRGVHVQASLVRELERPMFLALVAGAAVDGAVAVPASR